MLQGSCASTSGVQYLSSISSKTRPKVGAPRYPGSRCKIKGQATNSTNGDDTSQVLEAAIRKAYDSGYQAGYTAGVQVRVDVRLDGQAESEALAGKQPGLQSEEPDSLLRSAVKGLVWRVFSTAVTVTVVLVILKDSVKVDQALQFGAIEFMAKFLIYFIHERLWAQIKFK
ncbi:hypothetical protein WJX72_004549 [[Myrmecia] bisecta]|uniref:DUF2061 domain-containing protein n=1 Tax=[Myrmecia] bisecta TaxID=41462 RepID=A0AAW1R748_9CHLO